MKRLFIVRHAKSSWKYHDLADHERPLNGRGKRDAPVMGERLRDRGVRPDVIISSPAERAHKTAQKIANAIAYPTEDIVIEKPLYASNVSEILRIIHNLDKKYREVMIFGHNPEFTSLANFLSNHYIDNLPTCGIVCIDFNIQSWEQAGAENGEFIFFDFPKNID